MERRLFAQRLTGYLQCMRGRRLCRFPLLGKGKLHLHHRVVSASDGSLHQKCFRLIAGLFIRPGCFAVNRVVLLILSARLQNNGLTCRLNCAARSTTNTRNYHLFFQAPAPEDNLQTLSPPPPPPEQTGLNQGRRVVGWRGSSSDINLLATALCELSSITGGREKKNEEFVKWSRQEVQTPRAKVPPSPILIKRRSNSSAPKQSVMDEIGGDIRSPL